MTLSLKVGRYVTKNHFSFEEKISDMEGRYKNHFVWKYVVFLKNGSSLYEYYMKIGQFCTYLTLILDKIGFSVSQYCVTISIG